MDPSILALVTSFVGTSPVPVAPVVIDAPFGAAEAELNTHNIIKVIVFTKDRPWQLQQLFRSMRFETQRNHITMNSFTKVDIIIIGNVHELYHAAYRHAEREIKESMDQMERWSFRFWNEDETNSFHSLFVKALNQHADYTMFLTDDCVFLVPLDHVLKISTTAMSQSTNIFCFISRLHPGITWSQTRGKSSHPPRSHIRYVRLPDRQEVYAYPLYRGEIEWDYPLDLSGGVYKKSAMDSLVEALVDPDGLTHPNRFEISGNQALTNRMMSSICVFPTKPMLVIIAINRVQSICQAPIACSGLHYSPHALLANLRNGSHLDLPYYQNKIFNSSHIGDVVLTTCKEIKEEWDNSFTVSILIPVRHGPQASARHAVRSIIMQPIDEEKSGCLQDHLQLVIIDDQCLDGSVDAMLDEARKITDEDMANVSLVVNDTRDHSDGMARCHRETPIQITVEVYSSPKPGVASALNFGLSKCRSDLVARMDADDICAPGRLHAQLRILQSDATLDVVGTQTILFQECVSKHKPERKRLNVKLSEIDLPFSTRNDEATIYSAQTSLQPTDPGFVSWALLFSCCVAHSSVILRKSAVLEIGGYDESISHAEDYNLWLRMTSKKVNSIVSIPRIGLWHRKHINRSAEREVEQRRQSLNLSALAIRELVQDASDTAIETLKYPDNASSLDSFNNAAMILLNLEMKFIDRHTNLLTTKEVQLIRSDCDNRLGELAILSSTFSGNDEKSVAWQLWCERCPDHWLQQMALHATRSA